MRNSRKGFTLVELLVVISIIALLLAVLMPALQKAREQGKAIACGSNLHQFALAFSMYTLQYNGKTMPYQYSKELKYFWMRLIKPYSSDELRMCPSVTEPKSKSLFTANTYGTNKTPWYFFQTYQRDSIKMWGSYGINAWLYDAGSSDSSLAPGAAINEYWSSLNVKQPDTVPFLLDSIWLDMWPRVSDIPPSNGNGNGAKASALGAMSMACIDRHMKGINVLYVDMSCRKTSAKQLWNLRWSRTFDTSRAPTSYPSWMK